MYGKLMSIPDTLIMDYFQLLTDVPDGELAALRKDIEDGGAKARDAKARLAREVVSQFHGADAAEEANAGFERTFRKRELPEEAIEVSWNDLPFVDVMLTVGVSPVEVIAARGAPIKLATLFVQQRGAPSLSEARRLIQQGAVELDGRVVM